MVAALTVPVEGFPLEESAEVASDDKLSGQAGNVVDRHHEIVGLFGDRQLPDGVVVAARPHVDGRSSVPHTQDDQPAVLSTVVFLRRD